jgi:hypothetical protein
MKKYLLILPMCLLYLGLSAQANAIDTYFQQYLDDERFSVVYISPRLFQMFDQLGADELDLDDEEAAAFLQVASELRGLRILSIDEDGQRYFDEAMRKIDTNLYEPLMTVRDGSDRMEFLIRESSEGFVEEFLLISGGGEEFTLMSFVGRIDLDKVMEFAKEVEEE